MILIFFWFQMSEDQAFFLLRHLMFRRGLRKLYLPDMAALQLHLYQLSRLLHDRMPAIYNHFDKHEVSPTLYAAPWLLTLFASQFPLGFVTRVFGNLFKTLFSKLNFWIKFELALNSVFSFFRSAVFGIFRGHFPSCPGFIRGSPGPASDLRQFWGDNGILKGELNFWKTE